MNALDSREKVRFVWIDLLRTLSMIWIVAVWHGGPLYGVDLSGSRFADVLTRVSLATFTFLAGLVIPCKAFDSFEAYAKFILKKLLRLYPVYFGVATLYFAAGYGGIKSLEQYILSLTCINTFFHTSVLTIWYISMIFAFFIITPLFVGKFKGSVMRFILLYGFLLIVWFGFDFKYDIRMLYYMPFYYVGLRSSAKSLDQSSISIPQSILALSGFCVLLLSYDRFHSMNESDMERLVYVVLVCSAALILLANASRAFARHCRSAAVNMLINAIGYSSFLVYVSHRFFYFVFSRFCAVVPGYVFIAEFGVMCAVCYGCQWVYDMWVRPFANRIR